MPVGKRRRSKCLPPSSGPTQVRTTPSLVFRVLLGFGDVYPARRRAHHPRPARGARAHPLREIAEEPAWNARRAAESRGRPAPQRPLPRDVELRVGVEIVRLRVRAVSGRERFGSRRYQRRSRTPRRRFWLRSVRSWGARTSPRRSPARAPPDSGRASPGRRWRRC